MSEIKTQNDKFDDIRKLINDKLIKLSIPSITVAVAHKGEIIWEEGFGWADRENRISANEHTIYSLASISKPITATGLMILKERSKLDLDKPINDYLGDAKLKAWVGNEEDATVRRVANHSSGLPLHYQFFYKDEPYSPPSMDETIRRYGNLVTVPGEKYQYSNIGYGILDYLISRLSGKNYIDFMREEVFIPLGMTHTSVHIPARLEKYKAVRYSGNGLPIPFYDFDHRGASAVFSSAHDLVRFGMFHLKSHLPDQKSILTDETIDEMQKPTAEIANKRGYGIGWGINEDNMGFLSVGHNGGMGGVSTTLMLIPSEKLAVVVLSNYSSSLPDLICKEILSAMLPEYAKERSRLESEPKNNDESSPSFTPDSELIGKWSGNVHTYIKDIPINIWFKENGDVHVQLGEQLKTLLNDVKFKDGYLSGKMMGDVLTEDANRRPYNLHITFKLRDQLLNGAITAISLPGEKVGNALSHWAELKFVNRKT